MIKFYLLSDEVICIHILKSTFWKSKYCVVNHCTMGNSFMISSSIVFIVTQTMLAKAGVLKSPCIFGSDGNRGEDLGASWVKCTIWKMFMSVKVAFVRILKTCGLLGMLVTHWDLGCFSEICVCRDVLIWFFSSCYKVIYSY